MEDTRHCLKAHQFGQKENILALVVPAGKGVIASETGKFGGFKRWYGKTAKYQNLKGS